VPPTRRSAGSGDRIAFWERIRGRFPPTLRKATDAGNDVFLYSAGLAFYGLISAVPMTIVVLWVISLIAGDDRVHQLARTLSDVLPDNLGADKALVRVAALGSGLGVPAFVASLWPASAYGAGLRRAFDRLSPKASRTKLEGLRGRGLALVVLLPMLTVGTLAGALAATTVFAEGFLRILGWVLALSVAFVGAAVSVAVIYRIFPPEKLTWRAVARGTLVTAVGIAVLSLAFALLVGLGGDFQRHYGVTGFAAIVLLGVWLFLANAVLLVGYRVAAEG
jgi:membrane protein